MSDEFARRVPPISIGDVAVVTGGATRLGRTIGLALANDLGLDIVVHFGRSADAAKEAVIDIRATDCRSISVSADLREPERAAATIFAAAQEIGPVRVLINSAAVFEDRMLADISLEHWEEHFTVNALAPLMLSQRFVAQLPEGQTGHIINILDWRAIRPSSTHAVYTASKAALASLTKSSARQLAPRVRVNAVAPGAVLPPPGAESWHAERAAESIPLQQRGRPSDVYDAVLYLLRSSFVTGEILHVSGGEEL